VDAERLKQVVGERLARPVAAIETIPAGMGARRFFRIRFERGEPRSLVARCEPSPGATDAGPAAGSPQPVLPAAPAWLPEPPLEPLRDFLERAGLRVPRSHGHFPALGLELLEDVGPDNLLGAPSAERESLYRAACDFVPRLQALSAPADRIAAFGRRYDRALLETKQWKWLHWAIPGLLGRAASPREVEQTGALFAAIGAALAPAPLRLAHRDFKAENLHLLPPIAPGSPANGPRELVLIDVQGAFLAPPEYDLVCLLYDLQTDLDEALAARLFDEVRPRLPDRPGPAEARLRFDALAIARLAKDVAHVVHAGRARGDRRRWHEIPRGLELLGRAAARRTQDFPGIETLNSVILALTTACAPADIAGEGRVR